MLNLECTAARHTLTRGIYEYLVFYQVAPLVERCGPLLLEEGGRPLLEAVRALPSVQRMAALAYVGGVGV